MKHWKKLTIYEQWSYFKKPSICVVAVSKGEEIKGKLKVSKEIMVEAWQIEIMIGGDE